MFRFFKGKGRAIITTQIVIIASLIISIQAVGWLANKINHVANSYATNYSMSLTK